MAVSRERLLRMHSSVAIIILALAEAAQAQPVPLPMEKPVQETPVQETPVQEMQGQETPGQEKPSQEKPGQEKPPPPRATIDDPAPEPPHGCLQDLERAGIVAVRAADFVSQGQCVVQEPVSVEAVVTRVGTVDLPARPVLECRFAMVLAAWLREVVNPAGVSLLGSPVAALVTGPGQQCRNRAGGRLSEHAIGNAVDVAAFALADGRSVPVEGLARARGAERDFLLSVSTSACGYFTTVLGPGSDAAHADHLHVDLALRRSAEYRICMPR